jgi:ABC-type sugar transport system ATPase subunit
VGGGARIIVFDEPTSSLSQAEAERLFALIERLRARGVTCIYVSHRMPEIFRLCDAVTILRDGRHVATRPTSSLSESDLVQMMIGRPLAEYFGRHAETGAGEEVLRVEGLTVPGKFEDVSFALRRGEILGLAGLMGAGRSEVASALFGLERPTRGRIVLGGKPVEVESPAHAIRLGIGFVPEDRKRQGLVLSASGLHNTSLPILDRLSRLRWIWRARERSVANEYFEPLRVRTPSVDATVAGLSGGNQQKIVLAKWLATTPKVLIVDEPTRGIDVGTKAEVHRLMSGLAADGVAVLMVSSELPEVLGMADRVLVMREGRLVRELTRAQATEESVMFAATGQEAVA